MAVLEEGNKHVNQTFIYGPLSSLDFLVHSRTLILRVTIGTCTLKNLQRPAGGVIEESLWLFSAWQSFGKRLISPQAAISLFQSTVNAV